MVAIFGGKWWLLVARKKWRCPQKSFWDCFWVVLGTQNTKNNVWKMEYDEFYYYLRNKKKKQNAIKSKRTSLHFFYLYMKMKWWRNKKTSQEDKNTGFISFKFQDSYENLNLTNHTCECSSKMIVSFSKVPCFSVCR